MLREASLGQKLRALTASPRSRTSGSGCQNSGSVSNQIQYYTGWLAQ